MKLQRVKLLYHLHTYRALPYVISGKVSHILLLRRTCSSECLARNLEENLSYILNKRIKLKFAIQEEKHKFHQLDVSDLVLHTLQSRKKKNHQILTLLHRIYQESLQSLQLRKVAHLTKTKKYRKL